MDASTESLHFSRQGFAILASILSEADCDRLVDALQEDTSTQAGTRRLLRIPLFAETADAVMRHPAVSDLLSKDSRAVQCTLFAKGPATNWSVTPHQDLSIPVRERSDVDGWVGWSRKEGLDFVQPPTRVLEQLVAVRLQLDAHSSETGPLEVNAPNLSNLPQKALAFSARSG